MEVSDVHEGNPSCKSIGLQYRKAKRRTELLNPAGEFVASCKKEAASVRAHGNVGYGSVVLFADSVGEIRTVCSL